MPISRIYQNQSLAVGQTISLDAIASHYLRHVLRVELNQPIILFNGLGGEYRAKMTLINKKEVQATIEAFSPKDIESTLKIHLVQGLAKGEKMDWIIQKAVELGVHEITPLFTERSQVTLNKEREAKRRTHWHAIIVSACEQCGRNVVPQLNQALHFSDWIKQKKNNDVYILSPEGKEKLISSTVTNMADIALVIGPEGGWSPNELAEAERLSVKAVTLGPRILRTETAAIAALSVLQFAFGDLN